MFKEHTAAKLGPIFPAMRSNYGRVISQFQSIRPDFIVFLTCLLSIICLVSSYPVTITSSLALPNRLCLICPCCLSHVLLVAGRDGSFHDSSMMLPASQGFKLHVREVPWPPVFYARLHTFCFVLGYMALHAGTLASTYVLALMAKRLCQGNCTHVTQALLLQPLCLPLDIEECISRRL